MNSCRNTRAAAGSAARMQFKSLSAEAGLPANQVHEKLRIECKASLIALRLDSNLLRLWTHDSDFSVA